MYKALLFCFAAISAMGGAVNVLRFFDVKPPIGWWSLSNPSVLWAIFFSLIALAASIVGILAVRSNEEKLASQETAWKDDRDAKNDREGRLHECRARNVELEKQVAILRERLEVRRVPDSNQNP